MVPDLIPSRADKKEALLMSAFLAGVSISERTFSTDPTAISFMLALRLAFSKFWI